MGVYIKMEMPQSCYECRFNNGFMCYAMRDDNDYILNENTDTKRHSNCPLVEIVTCGECKYWHEGEWYNTCDKHIGHGFEAEHSCFYGERRTK